MDEKTNEIFRRLAIEIPEPKSELCYQDNFQLLVSVILSAQCTDKRVNMITPSLFAVAPTPEKMAELPLETVEQLIHSCGFYHNKAKFIVNMSRDLVNRYGGQVPSTLEELRTLDGVGQKTANVVYAVGFDGQAIAVDTHVFRVANRIGLARAKTPEKTEDALKAAIDKEMWNTAHHYLLLHGRYVCKSQKPRCTECCLTDFCEYYIKNKK